MPCRSLLRSLSARKGVEFEALAVCIPRVSARNGSGAIKVTVTLVGNRQGGKLTYSVGGFKNIAAVEICERGTVFKRLVRWHRSFCGEDSLETTVL
jgi:hypothetical protein